MFTPITIETQEQLDEMFKERVNREKDKFKGYTSPEELEKKVQEMVNAQLGEKDKQINELSASLGKTKEELEASGKTLAEKEAQIKAYEIGSAKTKIANELGLKYEAIEFISGEDEDSIRANAEKIKSLIGSNGAPAPAAEPTLGGKDDKDKAYKGMLDDMFGK